MHAKAGTVEVKLAGAALFVLGSLVSVLAFALSDGDGRTLAAPPGSPSDPPGERARQVLGMMTLEEKTRMLQGEGESIPLMAVVGEYTRQTLVNRRI
eukprot:COSAG02_NODE_495_length_21151_cov_31.954256_1_plen_96_part_10